MYEFHAESQQAPASEGLAQGPYVAAIAELEPTTLRTKGVEYTNAPPRPMYNVFMRQNVCLSGRFGESGMKKFQGVPFKQFVLNFLSSLKYFYFASGV